MPKHIARGGKRKRQDVVEEIVYDPEAREEYLTGFHKRKQQRIKHAQEIAARKEREARIEERKHIREQRAKDLENHVHTVNSMLKAAKRARDGHLESEDDGTGDETEPITAPAAEGVDDSELENEYIDEEKYTTVTVGPMALNSDEEEEEEEDAEDKKKKRDLERARAGSKPRPKERPKKKKKFRYEAPSERRAARAKVKVKNSAAAKARRDAKR